MELSSAEPEYLMNLLGEKRKVALMETRSAKGVKGKAWLLLNALARLIGCYVHMERVKDFVNC